MPPAEPFAIYRLRHDANGSAWVKDHIPPTGIFHQRGFSYPCDEDSITKCIGFNASRGSALSDDASAN